ncbi:MAG: hypothetical protein C5B59_12140 [Bacteroidetes bacterium]|nr:MAG: hypothetical protein C5B59_12140 [Bacteroidota bacterium]
MAQPNYNLINALRNTAKRLRDGAYYAWGHHGGCNCGNLLQVVANLSKEEILGYAHSGHGEWSELAEDFCEISSTPAYLMISKLQEIGLTGTDIHNLEYLEDREVLAYLPGGFRWLKRNVREEVILYLESFADMLEDKLAGTVLVDYEALLNDALLATR